MEEKLNQLTFANSALFGLLIAAAYFFLFYQPSKPQFVLEGLELELKEAKASITKLDSQIKEGEALKKEVKIMEGFVEKMHSQLSENISVSEAASAISQEARTVGLSIESIESAEQWIKKKTVALVPVQTSVVGTFSQIMVFLSELTRDNKVYSVSSLLIESQESDEDLRLTATIQAYRKLALSEVDQEKDSDDQ